MLRRKYLQRWVNGEAGTPKMQLGLFGTHSNRNNITYTCRNSYVIVGHDSCLWGLFVHFSSQEKQQMKNYFRNVTLTMNWYETIVSKYLRSVYCSQSFLKAILTAYISKTLQNIKYKETGRTKHELEKYLLNEYYILWFAKSKHFQYFSFCS